MSEGRRVLSAAFAAFLSLCPAPLRSQDIHASINELSRTELEGLGVLTPFQLESLLDYRRSYGDILSAAELSAVDGFDAEDIESLSALVSFDPSPYESGKVKNVLSARIRKNWSKEGLSVTSKYSLTSPALECGMVLDNDPKERFPDFVSAYISCKGAIVGDFKACFGQGLVMWNGMSFSSMGEPSAIFSRETLIRGYKSSDETDFLRGVAYSGHWGPVSASSFVALNEKMCGASSSYESGSCRIGVNAIAGLRSSGGIWANGSITAYGSMKNLRLFAEAATSEKLAPAVKIGAILKPEYSLELASSLWAYAPAYKSPHSTASVKDQAGAELAARYSWRGFKFNANLSYRHKLSVRSSGTLKYRVCVQYSFENGTSLLYQFRTGQHRLQAGLVWRDWRFAVRAEGNLRGYGLYGELSYRRKHFEACARVTRYNTDGWDSRIYFYERDVPQSFSTVAYYGKGTGAYILLKYTPVRYVDLWLKAQQNYLAFFTRITIPG